MYVPEIRLSARQLERRLLLVTSSVVLFGLFLTYQALSRTFDEVNHRLEEGSLLNINHLDSAAQLHPFLSVFPHQPDRMFVAERIYQTALTQSFPNVGYLNTLRATEEEILLADSLDTLRRKLLLLPGFEGNDTTTVATRLDSVAFYRLEGSIIRTGGGVLPNTTMHLISLSDTLTALTDAKGRFYFEQVPSNISVLLYASRNRFTFSIPERTARFVQLTGPPAQPIVFQGEPLTSLLSGRFEQIKPNLIVRSPDAFRWSFWVYAMGLYFLGIYGVHILWSLGLRLQKSGYASRLQLVRKPFSGDAFLLPLYHVLTGIGLMLMLSLRDPLRDQAHYLDFAIGVLLGAAMLFGFSLLDVQRWHREWNLKTSHRTRFFSFKQGVKRLLPRPVVHGAFWLCIGLSMLLIIFGWAPGVSDARVNLWGFQPSEFIKLLLVIFLAGYFEWKWSVIRGERHRESWLARRLSGLHLPRFGDVLPVVVATTCSLGLFFLQKDLGPALVLGCTFLSLYYVARHRALAAISGMLALILGFVLIYQLGLHETVRGRVEMMLHPWDNFATGGSQLAEAHWGLASGGLWGLGLGLGWPSLVPAAHTDMVLAVAGEELGLVGLVVIFMLYALLLFRAFSISQHAQGDFSFFLGLGLVLILGYQILLISGGILGLVPLSGVVSPFLSFGKSSMIANGIILGIWASLSEKAEVRHLATAFQKPVRTLQWVLIAAMALIVLNLGWIQALRDETIMVKPALVMQRTNERDYEFNRRFSAAAERDLTPGSIYDRNGLPLATSKPDDLETFKKRYLALGINPDSVFDARFARQYPFGAATFYLLGDLNRKVKWGARNMLNLEYRYLTHLRGFNNHPDTSTVVVAWEANSIWNAASGDSITVRQPVRGLRTRYNYAELIPLVREGNIWPPLGGAARLTRKNRDLYTTLDAALQLRLTRLLNEQTPDGLRSAAVVIDPQTGDVRAAVSVPQPSAQALASRRAEVDPAFFDRATFGTYPPGSTFKIATAIAALRKDDVNHQVTHVCRPFGGNRVGNIVDGVRVRDHRNAAAHGRTGLETAIRVSCNAYFAQLGHYNTGPVALLETITRFNQVQDGFGMEVEPFKPHTTPLSALGATMQQVSFGQGSLVTSPLAMASVAATVANQGIHVPVGWFTDRGDRHPERLLSEEQAALLARSMRQVVTSGTATRLAGIEPAAAGKTGTAENPHGKDHAWFIGYAPYNSPNPLAFAVMIEHGGSGGSTAAPLAGKIVQTLHQLNLIQ